MVERLERSLQLPASAALERSQQSIEESTSRPSSKRTVDEAEVLHSENEHRAWVFGATALMSAVLFKGLSEIHSWQGAAGSAAAVLAAYHVSGADILWQPISALTEFSSPVVRCIARLCRLSDGRIPLGRGQLWRWQHACCWLPDSSLPGAPPEALDHHRARVLQQCVQGEACNPLGLRFSPLCAQHACGAGL